MTADGGAGAPAPLEVRAGSPYPPSPAISLEWVGPETRREDLDGDDWPVTWAADDHLYAAYGDGWGARPIVRETKANTGLVRLSGTAHRLPGPGGRHPLVRRRRGEPQLQGLRSPRRRWGAVPLPALPAGHRPGHGQAGPARQHPDLVAGRRAAVGERPPLPPRGTARRGSSSTSRTTPSTRPTFLQAGRGYGAAQDGYAYLYSPRQNRRRANDSLDLARVPLGEITRRGAYEFFAGPDGDGARWTRDLGQRAPCVRVPGARQRRGRGLQPRPGALPAGDLLR